MFSIEGTSDCSTLDLTRGITEGIFSILTTLHGCDFTSGLEWLCIIVILRLGLSALTRHETSLLVAGLQTTQIMLL